MKKKKKVKKEEETLAMKNWQEENRMHDDHGDAVIGGRDKKPIIRVS